MTTEAEFKKAIATPQSRHRFFCFCSREYSTENYIAYMLIQAYKQNPRKRQAEFIHSVVLNRPERDKDKYGQLLSDELNISGGTARHYKAAANPAANLPKTFSEKVERWGVVGAIRHKIMKDGTKPDPNAFEMLERNLQQNLGDTFGRFGTETGPIQRLPWVDKHLPTLNRDLTAAGWSPRELGLW